MALLTIKDVAQRLQVKPSTLYAWVSQRRIPHLRVNGLIRFDETELHAWLERGCHQALSGPVSIRRRPVEPGDLDDLLERAKRNVL